MENNIAILERDLMRIIGERDYAEVKKFFKNVFEIDVTKVIAEGRTYALYKIFESIFKAEGKISKGGDVYTTHAISQIPKEQEHVLIVADVIEETNSIPSYITKLSELNVVELDDISVWCMLCNTKLNVEKLEPYFGHIIYVMPYKIRYFSVKLSEVVMRVNLGYLSFVNSYRFNNLTFNDISKFGYYNLIENDLHSYDDKIISKVLWGKFLPKDVVLTYRIKSCIRFYDRPGEMIAIPYVFLPPLKADKVCEYCKDLLSILSLNYPECFENDRELLYKWTIYAVSRLIFNIFIVKCKDETEKWDYDIIDNSDEVFGINKNVKFIEPAPLTFDGSQIARYRSDKYDFGYNMLCECLSWEKELPNALNHYLYLMRTDNEKKEDEGEKLYKGLMLTDILKIGEENSILEDAALSEIIRCVDSEKIVLSFENNHDNTIFGAFLKNGTHAQVGYYKELYRKAYSAHHAFFVRTREIKYNKHVQFAEFLDTMMETNEFTNFAIHLDKKHIFADFMSIESTPNASAYTNDYVEFFVNNHYNP